MTTKTPSDNLKAYGSATITWGKVIVAVKLYSPFEDNEIHFNQLHAKCGARLKQGPMYCPACEGAIPKDEIVKGYEYAEGKYVTFTKEETVKLESSKTIVIGEFVPIQTVDPLFFQGHYFLAPEEGAERAFALLAVALQKTNNAALGEYRARGKGCVVAIRPYAEDGLILHQLTYADAIHNYRRTGYTRSCTLSPKEIQLAVQLVESLETESIRLEEYRNTVREETMRLIEQKVAAGEVVTEAEKPAPKRPPADLMEQLKASLKERKV